MNRYRMTAQPGLSLQNPAFGAQLRDHEVAMPDHLMRLLAEHSLGDNAVANASFLASFPAAVARPLGLTPQAVVQAAQDLLGLLKDAGADVPASLAPPRRQSYGALPPGQLTLRPVVFDET